MPRPRGALSKKACASSPSAREGYLKPVFENGDRRYSGYVLAERLGWRLDGGALVGLLGGGPEASGMDRQPKRWARVAR